MTDVSKVAVVTGASSGIGEATARELARRGYRVVLMARQRDKLEAVAASIGAAATVEACDASDGDAVLAAAGRVLASHGAPDVIVNAAGAGAWKFIEDTTPAEALVMMQAPYVAAFNTTHAFMKAMLAKRRGVVIHVGSPASLFAWQGATGYAAARWALRGLHEALCMDLAGTGVKSCHVVLGKVASAYFTTNTDSENKIPGIANTIRTMQPDESGRVIADVAERPVRQLVYPFVLRAYYWTSLVLPWLVRWLVQLTGARR